jgi:hypothetical protein
MRSFNLDDAQHPFCVEAAPAQLRERDGERAR